MQAFLSYHDRNVRVFSTLEMSPVCFMPPTGTRLFAGILGRLGRSGCNFAEQLRFPGSAANVRTGSVVVLSHQTDRRFRGYKSANN